MTNQLTADITLEPFANILEDIKGLEGVEWILSRIGGVRAVGVAGRCPLQAVLFARTGTDRGGFLSERGDELGLTKEQVKLFMTAADFTTGPHSLRKAILEAVGLV